MSRPLFSEGPQSQVPLVDVDTQNGRSFFVPVSEHSREALLEQYDQARRAVSGARRVVEASAPNLRDYYPLPDGEAAYKRALAEHLSRVERLVAVAEELGAICEHLGGA